VFRYGGKLMDVKTIFLTNILVLFVMAGLLYAYMSVQKTYRGFGFWTLTTFLTAIFQAMMLSRVIFRGALADFFTIIIANTGISSVLIIRFYGIRLFFGREKISRAYYAIPVLAFLCLCYFYYIVNDIQARGFISTLAFSFMTFVIAFEFIRNRDKGSRRLNYIIAAIHLIYGAIFFTRGLIMLSSWHYMYFTNNTPDVIFFLTILLAELAWDTCFFMLNGQRVYSELETVMIEKDKAEIALKESERNLREVLDNSSDAVYRRSYRSNRFEYMSPASSQVLGYTPEEMLSMSIDEILDRIHPEDLGGVKEMLDAADREGGGPYHVEFRIKTKAGHYNWVADRFSMIRDDEGRTLYRFGTVRDITTRRNAEKALKESQERYRALFDGINNGVAVYEVVDGGRDFIFRDFNRAGEIMDNDDRKNLIGKSIFEARPGVEEFGLIEVFRRVWKTGAAENFPVKLYKDKRLNKWYDNFVYKLPSGEIVAVFEDVTKQKQAEEALKESESRFKSIFDYANDGILLIDIETRKFISCNMSFCNMLGLQLDMISEYGISDIVRETDLSYILDIFEKQIKREIVMVRDIPLQKTDGTIIYADVSSSLVEVNGKTCFCGFFRDITRRKNAEEERRKVEEKLQQAQKLESLGVLAGGIAHDFNNMLMVVLGNAELAQMEISETSPARQRLEDINNVAIKAADLCKQMLAYSGKGRFVIRPIDLSEVVGEMGRMLDVSVSKKAILNYNLAKGLPFIKADTAQIRQIIMNLIINASEAIGEKGGAISVETGLMECDSKYLKNTQVHNEIKEGPYVYLEIADTGSGMDKATMDKIFDPFFTTKFTGRGLGLAAVLGIVRGHNGGLMVDSEPGKGTTFRVMFPAVVSETETTSSENKKTVDVWKGSGTILLVDDDESIRDLCRLLLERIGFDVLTASDGRNAVEVFCENRGKIRCIILDLTMPHMDGDETFRELIKIDPDIRVIMSSGYNEQEIAQKISGKGFSGFIQKPYSLSNLTDILKKVLG
jgi:two-component system cell cycle sensor histidine kinase/response regulator CckA